MSSILLFHICAGAIGLLAGYAVIFIKKGQVSHKYLGRTYVLAMLSLGLTGTYIAVVREVPLSILNGLVLCYLVLSSLNTIWQTPRQVNFLDKLLFAFVFFIILGFVWYGYQTSQAEGGKLGGFGIEAYVVFGSVMIFCCIDDYRNLKRGGSGGNSRLVRHLWRMFFPLFMSTAAFFLGQAKHLPEVLQRTELLLIPVLFVFFTALFWVVKVRAEKFRMNQTSF